MIQNCSCSLLVQEPIQIYLGNTLLKYFLRPDKSPLFGTSFYINNQINILQMKKVKTFNQEVEHFGRVLEAEIQKKEC